MSKSLQEIRDALDEVDKRIVDALAVRHELITLVQEARQEPTTETARDEIREHEILARVEGQARQAGLDPDYVASLFHEIIQHSVDWQRRNAAGKDADEDPRVPLRVGYQGGAGAYSHLAASQHFGDRPLDCRGYRSFRELANAVERGKLVRAGDPQQAAIASREAARRHGLEVLKSGIANQRENYTRFLVIAREPEPCALDVPSKTSLVLATQHQKAALATCLNVLAERDLNLTKLESRPVKDTPWEYLFYIDFEGNLADDGTSAAVAELESHTSYLKILGSYPVSRSSS